MWVATFRLGDQEYSIPLSALRAAIPRRMVTSVPGAPRAVLGILQFSGEIIPAPTMACLLQLEGHAPTPVLPAVYPGIRRTAPPASRPLPPAPPAPVPAVVAAPIY